MFLRPHQRRRNGRLESYWALVESYRTQRGPRQRTVAWLGLMDEAGRLERELLAGPWRKICEGLEVQLCPCPAGGSETFVLCRSRDRRAKEQAMHARFERRIEEGLTKIAAGCQRRAQATGVIERRVGKLLGQNTRAAGLFDVKIVADAHGAAQVAWTKVESWRA